MKTLQINEIIALSEELKPLLQSYKTKRGTLVWRLPGNNRPAIERFAVKFEVDERKGCWNWIGGKDENGYGTFFPVAAKGFEVRKCAHGFIWEYLNGEVPKGLELDHLCRNTSCCNPEHLEPVTHRENIQRAKSLITHCPQGHPLSGENIYEGRSSRVCRKCAYRSSNASRIRRMEADPEYKERIAEENRTRARKNAAAKRDLENPNRLRRWTWRSEIANPDGSYK